MIKHNFFLHKQSSLPSCHSFKIKVVKCLIASSVIMLGPTYSSLIVAAEMNKTVEKVAESNAKKNYEISGDSLSKVLSTYASISGILLAFDPTVTENKNSKGLSGEYTLEEGFSTILLGTGLEAFRNQDGNYSLRKLAIIRPSSNSDEVTDLPQVDVIAKVYGQQKASDPVYGYKADRSSSIMKTDTSILNTPQSISVITQDIIEDRQVTDIGQALETATGITKGGVVLGGAFFNINSRGFQIDNEGGILLDGNLRHQLDQPLLDTIERIEVIKGPASVYGRLGNPGGMINIISKLPTDEDIRKISLRMGPFGSNNQSLDLGGKFSDDSDFSYRFVAGTQDGRTFRQGSYNNYDVFAGAVKWQFAEKSDFTVRLEHRETSINQDQGLVALPNANANPSSYSLPDIPNRRLLNQPYASYDTQSTNYGHTLNLQLTENWKIHHHLGFQDFQRDRVDGNPSNVLANGNYRINYSKRRNDATVINGAIDLIGEVDFLSTKHKLLFGRDSTRYDFKSQDPITTSAFVCNSNVYNPVFCPEPTVTRFSSLRPTIERKVEGYYFQDQMTLSKWLDVVVGARRDFFNQRSISANNFTADLKDQNFEKTSKTTPRVAFVLHPLENLSVYSSYSESFSPNGIVNRPGFVNDGQALAPEEGVQYEAGLKYEPFGGRLLLTAAAYQLKRENVPFDDVINQVVLLNGEVESKGIELGAVGQILPGWNISAGYSNIYSAEVLETSTANVLGKRLTGAPKHSANIWSSYEVQGGPLRGFGFGAGVFYRDSVFIDAPNLAEAPSYTRVDASVSYRMNSDSRLVKGMILRLNFNNVFDREYIASALNLTAIEPGSPRTVSLSGEFRF